MKVGWSARLAILLALALFTTGCGQALDRGPPPRCPPIFILKDAGSLTRYKPGSGRDITDVLFQAKITDFQGVCDYNRKRTEVEIGLNLVFDLLRGPANRDRKAAFRYFVAIPRFYPAPQGRNIFSVGAEFAGTSTRHRARDEITIKIPLDAKRPLEDYAIYIGFQLTPKELEDNRRVTKF
jgi:hypothetical protein